MAVAKRTDRSQTARVTGKGQTTIPVEFRRKAGIHAGDSVEFTYDEGRIVLKKVQPVDVVWNAGQSALMTEWNNPEEDVYNDLT